MTYLCCSSLPDFFSVENTAVLLKSRFCGRENTEYIDKIANRVPSAAAEGLYALTLLSKMLDLYFPEELHGNLILARSENGKPYFVNSPIRFSISHSGGIVACAISDSCELGIDVESANISKSRADGIVARFFDKSDLSRLSGDTDAFRREWTRKEAAAKMHGIPLAEYLKHTKNGDFDDSHTAFFFEFSKGEFPVTLCTDTPEEEIIKLSADIFS